MSRIGKFTETERAWRLPEAGGKVLGRTGGVGVTGKGNRVLGGENVLELW